MSAHQGRHMSSACTLRHAWEASQLLQERRSVTVSCSMPSNATSQNTQLAPQRVSFAQKNSSYGGRALGPSSPARLTAGQASVLALDELSAESLGAFFNSA